MNRDLRRIVDANLNRVTEGLRVVEDVFRFAFDDAVMQQRLKSMRHRLASRSIHPSSSPRGMSQAMWGSHRKALWKRGERRLGIS